MVGRSLERLEAAIPKEIQAKGKPLFLAQDVSTVGSLHTIVMLMGR